MDPTFITAIVTDARVLAKGAEDDAKAAAVTLLTHVADGATGDVPQIADAALNDLFTFIPAQYRGAVEAVLKPAEGTIDQAAVAGIKIGLGFALNRIAAIPEITVPAEAPATQAA